MAHKSQQAIDFYSSHPISLDLVLGRLLRERGGLAGVQPSDLWPHDQDHYGGLPANEALAQRAMLAPGRRVADFCAGLGGPARYYAHVYGVEVTAIELTPARAAGAKRLNDLVGLTDRVRVVQGDVANTELPDGEIDAVVSQEAFLHLPDKASVLREARRILRPGGRLAFSDLIRHVSLEPSDADLLWEGMAIQPIETLESYRALLEAAGFAIVSLEDLTEELRSVLRQRFAMYQVMRREAEAAGTPTGSDTFHRSYARYAELFEARELGGLRVTALKL
jgi:sarcosine/dimethylglycine N-methyltransferase